MSTETISPAMRTQIPNSHIELDERGRPWIAGTNLKLILMIVGRSESELSVEHLHRQYPRLSLAQLHAALSYYYDHQAEIDAQIEHDRQEFEEARRLWRETPQGQQMQQLKERSSAS